MTPGKGGQDFEGIPIYNTVADAKSAAVVTRQLERAVTKKIADHAKAA